MSVLQFCSSFVLLSWMLIGTFESLLQNVSILWRAHCRKRTRMSPNTSPWSHLSEHLHY
ncbi:hypothetical protein CCR75_009162 [Bremia lactucae]|uniref:Uncharacterized protein n=1 Tax=Bremia lactucae TaxID=4779 RepID=A0A976FGR2_BRELC|nr:hypothetical protein CCR75_009162 [Bremia lactucae]